MPIKVTVVPESNTGNLHMSSADLSVTGDTVDFSRTGLAFRVPCIRLREFYLVGEGRTLKAEITLPNGKVRMNIIGKRYEQTGQHISVSQYIIGAAIKDMSERDRGLYEEFLKGKKIRAGTLKLEVEEG